MLAADGSTGTTDPAFMAHSAPMQHWALAWWQGWHTAEDLEEAFTAASLKLAACKGSWWSSTAGPVTALLATLERLGWSMPSASETIDDLGNSWTFGVDSPAAITQACNASVRRWRIRRIAKAMPGLCPAQPDVGAAMSDPGSSSIIIDFAASLAPLIKGKRCKLPEGIDWEKAWAASLQSGINGGQWPQVRKAAVPKFECDSNLCQLCLAEPGTLEHRFRCSKTRPQNGWREPPAAAKLALGRTEPTGTACCRPEDC